MMRAGTLDYYQLLKAENLIVNYISIIRDRFNECTTIVDALKSHSLIWHWLSQARRSSLSGEIDDQPGECKHTHETEIRKITRSLNNRPREKFRLQSDYLRVMEDPKYLLES